MRNSQETERQEADKEIALWRDYPSNALLGHYPSFLPLDRAVTADDNPSRAVSAAPVLPLAARNLIFPWLWVKQSGPV
jgi:hypothetical protein